VSFDGHKLFALLPALYRLRDAQLAQAQQPGPLQSLLLLVGEQLAVIEEDLDQLYDNQFIETCAPWVIPYIGDLIGYRPVKGVAPAVASPRAEVAHTVSFRRRKGTALVLEQLARDATGWGAHAVEFFQLLATTQYMNHVRPHNYYAPDLRHWQPRPYVDSGFDHTAHKVDVRRIAVGRGRYNIQNIGIFLWSLNAYSVTNAPATEVAGNPLCYRFSPLGHDMPLFTRPVSQGADITAPAQPINVPDRLRRAVLCQDIRNILTRRPAAYYGAGKSLTIAINTQPVPPSEVQICDLSGADGAWANMPAPAGQHAVAIDPELGRIALRTSASAVTVSYFYGFNADIGGGEYPRASTFAASPEQAVVRVPGDFHDIGSALQALAGDGVVEITDNRRYAVGAAGLAIHVKLSGHIELRARDGCRPTLALDGEITITGDKDAAFDLNGIMVVGTAAPASASSALLRVLAAVPSGGHNQLSRFGLTHCTLVPGWSLMPHGEPQFPGQSVFIGEAAGTQYVLSKSILGAIRTPELAALQIGDSFVDAADPTAVAYAALDGAGAGGALTLEGCTVVGKVHAGLLSLASNCIFWAGLASGEPWKAPLWTERRQQGCVRFSYLPAGAITPRRYGCVTEAHGVPGPLFWSLRYGGPAYGKLLPQTADAIRRGADDGGEMGGFHFLLAPQRETDLRVRLDEYLPVGMEYGIFYET
jgi:hypothetical protein